MQTNGYLRHRRVSDGEELALEVRDVEDVHSHSC